MLDTVNDSEWVGHGLWPQGIYNLLKEINHTQKIYIIKQKGIDVIKKNLENPWHSEAVLCKIMYTNMFKPWNKLLQVERK